MLLINFGRSFFDFHPLNQFDYFIRYITLAFIAGLFISLDKNLIIEVNQFNEVVRPYEILDGRFFFIKHIQFLGFLLFWLGARRFKDMLNLKEHTTLTFCVFLLSYLLMSHFSIQFILIFLLLIIPARKKKTL